MTLIRGVEKLPSALFRKSHFHTRFVDGVLHSSIVSSTDKYGRIVFVNKSFENISGYTRHELLGKPHSIINSGYHSKYFWKQVWNHIRAGHSWRGEVCNRSKDGTLYWVDTFIYPYYNEQGELKEYFSIRNDITLRKVQEEQLAKSETQLRAIFNSTTDIYLLLSPGLKLLAFNNQARNFTSAYFDPARMEETVLNMLRMQEGFEDRFNEALKGNRIELEREALLPDGKRVWHYVKYLPAFDSDGCLIGVSINLTNIHLRKMQEQALRNQNKVLSDVAWSQAHELRRPVASILGLIQLLEMDDTHLGQKEFVQHLKSMATELDVKIRRNVKQASEAEATQQLSVVS